MTSRMSPTSGLAADVAIVDALRVVGPSEGGSPQPPCVEESSWARAGALERAGGGGLRIKGPWPLEGVSGGKT